MRVLIVNSIVDLLTHYLNVWTDNLVKNCKQDNNYIRLKDKRATKKHFNSVMKKQNIKLVLLNGHGSSSAVFGVEQKAVVDSDNVSHLDQTVTHALACSSAKELGLKAIQHGALSYIGYDEEFVACLKDGRISDPLKDDTASLFLNPAFTVPKALLNGKSPDEAVKLAKKEYNRSIIKALNSDIQSDNDQFVSLLLWDREHLKNLQPGS